MRWEFAILTHLVNALHCLFCLGTISGSLFWLPCSAWVCCMQLQCLNSPHCPISLAPQMQSMSRDQSGNGIKERCNNEYSGIWNTHHWLRPATSTEMQTTLPESEVLGKIHQHPEHPDSNKLLETHMNAKVTWGDPKLMLWGGRGSRHLTYNATGTEIRFPASVPSVSLGIPM